MKRLISPSELLDGATVAWFTANDPNKNPAWIAKVENEEDSYEATVNEFWLEQVKESERRLLDYCPRLDEVSHVRYKTFEYEITNELHRLLFNLFEDVRIEFRLMMEFPGLVQYFRALFGFITEAVRSCPPAAEQAANDLGVLLGHLRLGKKSPDNWLVQFVEPILEVVRRGSVEGAHLLAVQVLALLLQRADDVYEIKVGQGVTGAKGLGVTRTKEQSKIIGEAGAKMSDSEDPRSVADICEDKGLEAGPGSEVVREEFALTRDPRWDNVVRENVENITTIQQALRRLYNKVVLVEAKRGDLNLAPHRMQQAYVDSFVDGTVSSSYFRVFRRDDVEVDVVLYVDQSGSMQTNAKFVSEACILTAAAVSGVRRARLAVAGFGKQSGTSFIKEFASPAWFGDYSPVADGGTPMGQCMKDVAAHKRYQWRRRVKRLGILLTDGQPDRWPTVREALDLKYYKDVVFVPICVGRANAHYEATFGCKPMEIQDLSGAALAIFKVIAGEATPWTANR
jgi:hypothetical protein